MPEVMFFCLGAKILTEHIGAAFSCRFLFVLIGGYLFSAVECSTTAWHHLNRFLPT